MNATTLTLGLAQVDESNFGLARAELAAIGVLHSRARELLPYLEAAHKAAATVCPAAAAAMRNTKRQRKHDVDDSARDGAGASASMVAGAGAGAGADAEDAAGGDAVGIEPATRRSFSRMQCMRGLHVRQGETFVVRRVIPVHLRGALHLIV